MTVVWSPALNWQRYGAVVEVLMIFALIPTMVVLVDAHIRLLGEEIDNLDDDTENNNDSGN